MRQGLLPWQVAQRAGISRSYIQRLETGVRTRMRPGTYARLRAALHATDEELLAPLEDPSTTKEKHGHAQGVPPSPA